VLAAQKGTIAAQTCWEIARQGRGNRQPPLPWSAVTEAAMPLMYLPLIMYTSWMQSMLQPFGVDAHATPRAAAYPDATKNAAAMANCARCR
jgi:hypothetical protein